MEMGAGPRLCAGACVYLCLYNVWFIDTKYTPLIKELLALNLQHRAIFIQFYRFRWRKFHEKFPPKNNN